MNSVVVRCLYVLVLLFAGICPAYADDAEKGESRPVTSVYSLEIGRGGALSTYLSPLRYSGTAYGISGRWMKALPWNAEHAVMGFMAGVTYQDMLNPSHSAAMSGLEGSLEWGMAWRCRPYPRLQLSAGGDVIVRGGALYLARNGNNPVTARAYAGVAADMSVSYHFRIGRLPILVSDRVSVPSLGAFFCPEYGETYYEIYLGNRQGLAHCAWWGNHFAIDNCLSLTLDFGRTAMEVGYRYSYSNAYANHLTTRVHSNTFVIGVIPQGIGLKKRNPKAIYAGY